MNFILTSCLIAAVAIAGAFSERSERICEPGSTRKGECGPCTCNSDGTQEECENAGCTGPVNFRSRIVRAAYRRCRPGEYFRMGCNICKCPWNGNPYEAACTLVGCR